MLVPKIRAPAAAYEGIVRQMLPQKVQHVGPPLLKADDVGQFPVNFPQHPSGPEEKGVLPVVGGVRAQIEGNKFHEAALPFFIRKIKARRSRSRRRAVLHQRISTKTGFSL